MIQQRYPGFLSWSVVILGLSLSLAGPQQPEIRIEKKPVSIPAGPNQKPFDVTWHSIPLDEIQSGGPPKDGIPALSHPAFTSAAEASRVLRPSDVVLAVEFDGVAKAYPVRILNWHEVVNDDVGRQPVLISWCPLCGSGIVYDPRMEGQRRTFGVSGLLYKRNLLLYDRETESLWSQLGGVAVTGSLAGTSLPLLPVTVTTWEHWKSEHPQSLVLSFETGFQRDYLRDPYRDLQLGRRLALVIRFNGKTKLYPFPELEQDTFVKAGAPVTDDFGGQRVTVEFDAQHQTASVRGPKGEPIPQFISFLADARAFYPEAEIFTRR